MLAATQWHADAGVNAARLDALLRDCTGGTCARPGCMPARADRCQLRRALAGRGRRGHRRNRLRPPVAEGAAERGCPSSIRLSREIQRRASRLSLAEIFRPNSSRTALAAHGDFFEGIRALLIDKDKAPRWNPATLADTAGDFIETFFTAPCRSATIRWPIWARTIRSARRCAEKRRT